MRAFFLALMKFYQRYLSVLSYGSCRYYPTCSEYAKWQLKHNNIFFAFYAILLRILRCNGLFRGGIDYPIISVNFQKVSYVFVAKKKDMTILFWFVPKKNGHFYVIKTF